MLVQLEGVASDDSGVCVVSAAVVERIADARGPREEVMAITRRREDCIGDDIQLAMAVLASDVLCAASCYDAAAMPRVCAVVRQCWGFHARQMATSILR